MRRKSDPVDIAFRAWVQLDEAGKQRLADRQSGFMEAVSQANWPDGKPAPRVRQRKAKHIDITNRPDKVLGPAELAQMGRGVPLTSDIPPKTA